MRAAPGAAGLTRLPSLTGTRFLAAFFVLGFHLAISGLFAPGPALDVLEAAFAQGAIGVSFFFVLSGFVLTWSARVGDTSPRFWRRRWAKIFPNHLVTWAVALVGLVATGRVVLADEALATFFLVQAWWPTERVFFGVNTVSWSLSAEAFFYLCFPALFLALRRLAPDRLWWVAGVAGLAVMAVPLAAQALPADLRYWFVFVFPLTRCLEFALGMLMARILREGRWSGPGVWPATALVAAAYVASKYLPVLFQPAAATVIPFALLITALAHRDVTGGAGFWRRRRVVWLGEISFAMYLVHQLVIRYAVKGLDATGSSTPKALAISLAVIAVSVALAALLYRWVEVPMMRRLGGSRPAATGRPTSARATVEQPYDAADQRDVAGLAVERR